MPKMHEIDEEEHANERGGGRGIQGGETRAGD